MIRAKSSSQNRTVNILLLLFLLPIIPKALSQLSPPPSAVNLGSFSLQRSPSTGDLQLGLGQGANIFGFGADREVGLNIGPGRFGTQIDNGLLLAGRRFGVDSQLGYQEGRGINLGSILNLFQPIGQLVGIGGGVQTHAQQQAPFFPSLRSASPTIQPTPNEIGPAEKGPIESQNQQKWHSSKSEERFPPSVGNGWVDEREDGEEEGRVGGAASDPFERKKDGTAGSEGMEKEEKHYGSTENGSTKSAGDAELPRTDVTEKPKKIDNKLPIPDGLEPLQRH